ncbi:hypothetical protein AV530_009448 [Patagioenas fasciata monilis]|uniref:Uncharacterized protein n=1 Tax=Patagioenas fasciata monilis TaxID=372326 RepID=A0A1V4JX90_PATFA|nr:hypothetical protein AV530_009448 [Patagioenas fasciata monilis]
MEMGHDEPAENIASFNCKSFIMGLVGFEMTSIKKTSIKKTFIKKTFIRKTSIKWMSIKPLTDHDNYWPLWTMREKQKGHQVLKSSATKAGVERGSQGAPSACKRLVKATHGLTLKTIACFQGVRLLSQPRKHHRF